MFFCFLITTTVLFFAAPVLAQMPLKIGLLVSGKQSESVFVADQLNTHLMRQSAASKLVVSIIPLAADHDLSQLPALARELVSNSPGLLVASSQAAARAFAQTGTKIPIIFVSASDPVVEKLVHSMNRPGANITGVFDYLDIDPKLTETACRWLTQDQRVVFVFYAGEKIAPDYKAIRAASTAFGCNVDFLGVSDLPEMRSKLQARAKAARFAVVMPMNFVFFKHSQQVIDFLNEEKIPAIYERASSARSGGLMAYGPKQDDVWKHVARIANRILSGESPATIPVERNRDVEFVINLKTATRIGYRPPSALLLSADRVIED